MLVVFQGARKSSLSKSTPSGLPPPLLGGRELVLQLQSHPSAQQKVCCTEKFHQSTDLKYTLPICVMVQSLLIFTVETYYTAAEA